MKKLLLKIALVFACIWGFSAQLGAAEESGVFLGFEIGAGEMQLKTTSGASISKLISTNALYGGQIGYKILFNDWIGLRAYANVNYGELKIVSNGVNEMKISSLVYAANADFLLNFINAQSASVGVFLGIAVGAQTINDASLDISYNFTGFYSDAKAGLRANMGHHGVDLIGRIPFVDAKKNYTDFNVKARRTWQVSLAYNYTF